MMMTRMALSMMAIAAAAVALGAAQAKPRKPAHRPPAAGAGVLHISSHLAEPASVSVDGAKAVTAPGYGSVVTAVAAGHHTLKVTSAEGVSYSGTLDLSAADLMTWKGKGYWCVNLLESELQPYSKDECQEDVTDAG